MSNLKIYNVNEVEWYVALSEAQLIAYMKQEYGDGWGETDDDEIIELTDEDLDKLTFFDDIDDSKDPANADPSHNRTFREQLKIVEESGEKIPCMFATSEY